MCVLAVPESFADSVEICKFNPDVWNVSSLGMPSADHPFTMMVDSWEHDAWRP